MCHGIYTSLHKPFIQNQNKIHIALHGIEIFFKYFFFSIFFFQFILFAFSYYILFSFYYFNEMFGCNLALFNANRIDWCCCCHIRRTYRCIHAKNKPLKRMLQINITLPPAPLCINSVVPIPLLYVRNQSKAHRQRIEFMFFFLFFF